ncbi:MAG: ABC transporter permease [Lachnospiraceae bacterium]
MKRKETRVQPSGEKEIIYSSNRIILEGMILSVLLAVSFFLPFASYTYKKVTYTVTGLELFLGKTIAGGSIVVPPSYFIFIIPIVAVLILIISITHRKIGEKYAAAALTIAAVVSLIANIVLAMQLESLMKKAKSVGISYGSIIAVLVSLLLVIFGLRKLWKSKVISTLDFMIIPGLLYFIVNNYIPMIGIAIAFKQIDYSLGIFKSPWVGLQNFKVLFANNGNFFQSDAFIITRNTLLYNLVFIILGTVMGIIVGICLADIFSKAFQKFFQTSILLPQLISTVIVAYIVFAFLSNETGLVNKMLGDGNEINFYSEKMYWPFILVAVYIWKQIGYSAIIFLSSIVGIDKSLYEAARVDGCSRWKQIRFVTLPLLKPTIITLMLLQVGRIFYSDFGLFYQVPMDSGALYPVTNTIDTYVYRSLMVLNNISVASAASTYQAIVGFIIVISVNLIVRKVDKENALF